MNFKKLMLLTIFSAALAQNSFCATAEPSQATEKAKTQGTSRAGKAFRGLCTLTVYAVVAGAGVFAGVCYNEEIRKTLPQLFNMPEKRDAEFCDESPAAKKFDFIQAYGIRKYNDKLYVKYEEMYYQLQKNNNNNLLFFNKETLDESRVYSITKNCHNFIFSPVYQNEEQVWVYDYPCTNLDTLLKASDLPQDLEAILHSYCAPVVV